MDEYSPVATFWSPPVTEDFLARNDAPETVIDRTGSDYVPTWQAGIDPTAEGLETLWEVSEGFERCCLDLAQRDAAELTPEGIVDALHAAGQGSVLPSLAAEQIAAISEAGKMPQRKYWQAELEAGTVGLDALFTLAGLHSFAKDQAALDDRIRKLLG